MTGKRGILLCAAIGLLAGRAEATVEMQMQAKRLGFSVASCVYCHATPHSIEVMKQRAKALDMNDGNCLACHGANIPAKLNARGHWLVAERIRRGAKTFDMAWLKDYKEPAPASHPATPAKPAKP